jgi:hypothetical protein
MGKSSISILSVPDKRIDLVGPDGQVLDNRNAFAHFMSIVLETTPQRTKVETFLAHSVRTRLDDLVAATPKVDAKKNGEAVSYPPVNFELPDAELQFVKTGFEKMQQEGKIIGSGWYYLVDALENAKAKAEAEKTE